MLLNNFIDHTLLKPTATLSDIQKLCQEAIENDFFSVCVNPFWVKEASKLLEGTSVKVCTVIGFPLGANTLESKKNETLIAINDGADEIDMVLNISKVMENDFDYILNEIDELKNSCQNRLLKVIVETSFMNNKQKNEICNIVKKSNADYIKTSTGTTDNGATIEDIKLFKSILGDSKKIKASGGVRTTEFSIELIKAGASRLGTSGGVQIINGLENTNDY